jgi:hypothetical protein
MAELAAIEVLDDDVIQERIAAGLMEPLYGGDGLQVVDCGDYRQLTKAAAQDRFEAFEKRIVPARILGAASELGIAALMAIAAQEGEQAVANLFNEYGEDTLVFMAAKISTEALIDENVDVNQHSASSNEMGNSFIMTAKHANKYPLGCKLNLYAGAIISNSVRPETLYEASYVSRVSGQNLPLTEAQEGAVIISKYIAPDYEVTRKVLGKVISSPLYTPTTVLKDMPDAPGLSIVMDLGNYRSDAAAHIDQKIPRFHHTPEVNKLVGRVWHEHELDAGLLYSIGILVGMATAQQLQTAGQPLGMELIAA